jgi:GDP-L-fucose synthase
MEKNSKILIAGYKGMVGSAITKKLQESDYSNLLLIDKDEIDLTRQIEVETLFDKEQPEYVVLAAAKVGGILANNTYKADFIYANMAIALNVIHTSYKYKVKKLLNLGSSCIYPKNALQPLKEEYLLTGELEQTNEPYAIAKISAIKLCRYYNEQYECNFISLMPTNLYGMNDNYNLETSHVLPAMIRKFILAKELANDNFEFIKKDLSLKKLGYGFDSSVDLNNKSITEILSKFGIEMLLVKIWGTGKVKREFLFADDLADAAKYLLENYNYSDIGEIVNIGTGIDLTIAELAEKIKNIVNYNGNIEYDMSKPDGTNQKLLDISKIKKLGWSHQVSLNNGLKFIIEQYYLKVNNYDVELNYFNK